MSAKERILRPVAGIFGALLALAQIKGFFRLPLSSSAEALGTWTAWFIILAFAYFMLEYAIKGPRKKALRTTEKDAVSH